ncbi:MAG: radical SAM protein [Fibromonadaceae bacterium]|jgi:radical SAM protein with 4Fe4S-binding SPASM domain|nr:radical SAM protein [Fibromonadaceae bacterium]
MNNINWLEKRTLLKDVLPLSIPLNIKIEPIHACNFKCIYCTYSTRREENKRRYPLTMEMFQKFIDGCNFNEKIKSISFSGLGEPLLNKDTPKFISMSKEIAKETILITNGSLLTKTIINKLIEAQLDTIRISLQGLSAEDYKKNCDFNINIQNFLEHLEYFYKNKTNTKIWVKMPDIILDSEDKKEKYYELFKDKCDYLMTMTIQRFFKNSKVDYSNMQIDNSKSMYGGKTKSVVVCPQPFYTLCVLADGTIYPCCTFGEYGLSLGNINENTVFEIWNSEKLKKFRLNHLKSTYNNMSMCKNCEQPEILYNHYDDIDFERERLIPLY